MNNSDAAEINSDDRHTTVVLKEDLDLYTVPAVRPMILEAVNDHPDRGFRIDLTRVNFVDSAGLALLLSLRKNPSLEGRLSVLVATQSHPERVLQLTRLDSYIDVISMPALPD